MKNIKFYFKLLTRIELSTLFFYIRVSNSNLKNIKFHYDLQTQWSNFYFFTFELVTLNWKILDYCSIDLFSKNENKIMMLNYSHWRFPYWNEIFYNSGSSKKNIAMLHFLIIDIDDLGLNDIIYNMHCIILLCFLLEKCFYN